MTDSNKTAIVLVGDRSGSMSGRQSEVIEGLNKYIAEQRGQPGEATITVHLFDNEHQRLLDAVPLSEIPDGFFTPENYVPRGTTALHDALGLAIDAEGARLAALPEDERPGRVLVVVYTDGEENDSCLGLEGQSIPKYDRYVVVDGIRRLNPKLKYLGKVADMVEHQTKVYNWRFIFLGSDNLNVESEATSVGIPATMSRPYSATRVGATQEAFLRLSTETSQYRKTGRIEGDDGVDGATSGQPPATDAKTPEATASTEGQA